MSSGVGTRTTGSRSDRTRVSRLRATCCASWRRARGRLAGASWSVEETGSEAACASRVGWTDTTLAIQGPPGSGKTYYRRADDPRAGARRTKVGITGE